MQLLNKQKLFTEILQEAESIGVSYVMIRHKDSVIRVLNTPSTNEDIDVYISKNTVGLFIEILRKKGFIRFFQKQLYINIESGMKIEIHSGSYTRLPFCDENFFLNSAIRSGGVNYLPDDNLFLILLMHPLDVTGLRGHRKYTQEKECYLLKHKDKIFEDNVKNKIQTWCGLRFYKTISRKLFIDLDSIYRSAYSLKIKALLASEEARYFFFNRCKKRLYELCFYQGRIITVMGIDGSGKTTLIDNISASLHDYLDDSCTKIVYMGFLGGYFLPIEKLSSLYRAIYPRPSIASEDKEIEENPLLYTTSSFKLGLMSFLLALEYLVRNTVIIWYAYFRKKTILLDRSIFDQHTKFSKLKIISFLRRFLVKPDIFIFLKGDTSIFFRRKQEYQISTLKFSQEADLKYLRKNFPLKLNELDANQSLQTVHLQAMDLLSEKLR